MGLPSPLDAAGPQHDSHHAAAGSAATAGLQKAASELPNPHYGFESSDPTWMRAAVQFHGHLGPWAALGLRMGIAGREAVEAEGYFDLEVLALGPFEVPPKSCLLDGLQVATGATWGKRNIDWQKADEVVVRITNTRTGQAVEIRPTKEMMQLVTSFKPKPKATVVDERESHEQDEELEAIARKVAHLPVADALKINELPAAKPRLQD